MKTTLALSIGISGFLAFQSCSSDPETKTASETAKNTRDSLQKEAWFPETDFDTLRGLYTGNFGDGFINIALTYVNDKKAIGYNIHKGLQRNISGSVVQKSDCFELTLNEPGDNPYDGIFTLVISKKDGSVQANWTANDPKIKAKKFSLKKQATRISEDSKSIYDGGEMNETNFMELFSDSDFESGHLEFRENGVVLYTYYPDGQVNEQQEIIKGSWKIPDPKTVVIEWSKNPRFNPQLMTFQLKPSDDEGPTLVGPKGLIIYPEVY